MAFGYSSKMEHTVNMANCSSASLPMVASVWYRYRIYTLRTKFATVVVGMSVAVVGVGAVDPTPTCSWTDGTCAAQLVLTVDMLPRPLGLEEAPRFGWRPSVGSALLLPRGTVQVGYRLQVSASTTSLKSIPFYDETF
eukprot:gene6450-35011_t